MIKTEKQSDVVIVGAGAAGLTAALRLAEAGRRVTVLSEAELSGICASAWAQGGIAAAVAMGDSAAAHGRDTLKAAAGTADRNVVRALTRDAPDYIKILERYGVAFKRDSKSGGFALNHEACHSRRRVLRAEAGDGFGKELMRALTAAVAQEKRICFVPYQSAAALVREFTPSLGALSGVMTHDRNENIFRLYPAAAVILATGGIGALYSHTTNPAFARGSGIALAARAGAVLADMEFVQFHPTALALERDPAPLATEALRGDGALLVTQDGRRFMPSYHPRAELAPRDIVSRAVFAELSTGNRVFLDCRNLDTHEFPALREACLAAGLDPQNTPVPVHPAAHYHMGGVAADVNGRSSVHGLWVCGEVASTGLHGANRLASNSLMEAVVTAGRAAADIHTHLHTAKTPQLLHSPDYCIKIAQNYQPQDSKDMITARARTELREVMTRLVGVARHENGLKQAVAAFRKIEALPALASSLTDAALVARLIATAALQRRESRGGHFRADYPQESPVWKHRSFITLKQADYTAPAKEKIYA
ncbi:MAG: L-aspartate oxidase [Micavibrio sp.]|nr:MAG: L-aspartate oxidase [Micavibrio sp.]